jgi:hypothetical protein
VSVKFDHLITRWLSGQSSDIEYLGDATVPA